MRLIASALLLCAVLGARDVRVQVFQKGIVNMPLEEYVAGVLMGEASTLSSFEALKAMAVAARTFAQRYVGRHQLNGFDFCETTHCQDYRAGLVKDSVRLAVEATDSEFLWYEGKLAATYYSQHCGGTTASGKEVWSDLYAPYLRSGPDSFCLAQGRAEWHSEVAFPFQITRLTASGRVAEVMANGRRMTSEQFQTSVGENYGWNILRSNRYGVTGSRISGIGRGHGVGMCQVGAEERGKAGQGYDAILAAYYPGTALGAAASGLRWRKASGERVDVFATDDAGLRELIATADRALIEAERTTGFRAESRPRVRSYPTIAVYRDATGDGGHIAGSTSGNTVRLQPAGLLRSRGIFVSTMFHEMLHVLIEANARKDLPDWYREELAQYLSGGRAPNLRQYDKAKLLDWVRTGLPLSVVQTRQSRAVQRVR